IAIVKIKFIYVLTMIFPLILKLLFEKIFISVLTHGYALTLTFLFYSSPVC
ncbi:hypothetical protein G3D06_004745, partial [Salmonella enterica]|nr:hypothetical protein [Salmonella enterica subsp. enterica serovar Anatum]EEH7319939.1 hypothetical protein [Salmonella enterica]